MLIQNEKIKNDYVYLSWLARCCMYINHNDDYVYLQINSLVIESL